MEFENDPKFEALKSRLQQNPDSLLFARVAEQLLNKGQVDEATRICEEGTRKHPYYVTGRMVLGKCYLQKKMFDLAEKEFKRVLLFDPKYIAAHKFYGDLMREAGWPNACEMSYKKILAIDPLDRTAKEMLETLERVKPAEQAILTPGEEAVEQGLSQTMDLDSGEKTEEFEEIFQSGGTRETETVPATESINIDDDLFADVAEEQQETESVAAEPVEQVSAPPPTEDVTSILDDIFEDDLSESSPEPQTLAPNKPEEIARQPEEELPDTGEVEIENYTEPLEKPAEADITPPPAEESRADRGFEEETLEFDQMELLEEEASENLAPADDSVMDMIDTPAQTAEPKQQDDFSESTEEIEAQDIAYDTDEIDTFASPQIDDEDQPGMGLEDVAAESPETASQDSDQQEEEALFATDADQPSAEAATPEPAPELHEHFNSSTDEPEAPLDIQPEPAAETPMSTASEEPAITVDVDEPALQDMPEEPGLQQESPATAEPEEQEQTPAKSSGGSSLDREKIVTPTLGEIYAAQGQFAKAINVFEMLLKKDPSNEAYLEKIEYLKQRLEDNQDA